MLQLQPDCRIIMKKSAVSLLFVKAAAVLTIAIAALPIHAADLREGLVSFWPFEVSDGVATPDLASGNTMSIVGAPVQEPGQVGNAFTFAFEGASYLVNNHTPDNSLT